MVKVKVLSLVIFTLLAVTQIRALPWSASLPWSVSSPTYSKKFPSDTSRRAPGVVTKAGPYRPTRTLLNDILHTRLDLRFDWLRQQVIGTALISFKPYFYPQNHLILDAKGFEIQGIYQLDTLVQEDTLDNKITRQPKRSRLEYAYDRKQLTIGLPRAYTRNEKVYVQIDYVAKPNELARDAANEHPEEKGLYFINADGMDEGKPQQIWTQGETQYNSAWFPTVDSPNEKMLQDFYLTVDTTYQTLSNGLLVSDFSNGDGTRTDHWRQTLPHAPYLAMIAVGK